jgi:hypothetical protein
MKRVRIPVIAAAILLCCVVSSGQAQLRWVVGGNTGLSLLDGTAGFHIGPMAEAFFNKNMAVGSEISINTQSGTPVIWYNYFKYHFAIQGSKLKPYGDAGLLLNFMTGGPYFGLLFGGGVNIPMAPKLFISPELQMGPIFSVGGGTYSLGPYSYTVEGSTLFAFIIRGGIRYEL